MNHIVLIRMFDIVFSFAGLTLGFPVLLLIWFAGLFDTGSPIFCQERVGLNKRPFLLVKFRTMALNTDSVATHLVNASSVTRLGTFLRRTKLDELPQLWNVLNGDMSFVGPRPCLFNQHQLIEEREKRGVFDTRPGITGLAQISGIDMSTPELLAKTDQEMISNLTLPRYFAYMAYTLLGKGMGDRVKNK